jgi:HD-GYP domain-containing protein (c-di-GMP phosphodiesterase class II)
MIIISAIYVYKKGYRAAKYFIIAWVALLSGTFFFFGKNLGLVPNNTITSYAFHVGVALEVILLSFALADRINLAQKEKYETQKNSLKQLEAFLLVLASAIESKDAYTGGHVERVANYARDLAEKAGIDGENLRNLYLGAMVHDVGKIGVPDNILNKPGKLDSEEMKEMQNHPGIGKRLLSKIDGIEVASNIVFSHQEKFDGTGYPQGIIKNEISLEARIVTIADYWDAIITDRPYRKAMPLKKAISIMKEEAGKAFDPELFNLFMNDIDKLYLKYVDKEKLKELELAD